MRLDECPVKAAIDVIGGKWKPLILFELKDGPRRFGELRRTLGGIRHKVLIEQLKQLEQDGVVSRIASLGKIPQTEYDLSGYGKTLRPVLSSLAAWGADHRARHGEPPPGIIPEAEPTPETANSLG